jgi:membrane-associated phospholipid phosphatase
VAFAGLAALAIAPASAAPAALHKGIETAGTAVAIALPIAAGGISLMHHGDWRGVAELTETTVLTVGAAYVLKQIVHEQRPDHSDFHSFPSDTAALAFAPANYLWDRYGWEYGVPAYGAAVFVGYARVDAQKHHWYDVAASAAMAFGFNYALTTHYRDDRVHLYASARPDEIGLNLQVNW